MKKTILISLVAVLLSSPLLAQDDEELTEVPKDLKVYTLDGEPKLLGDIINHDGLVLLDFWATWCKPCLMELSTLKDETPQWEKDYNAKLVLISIDEESKIEKIKNLAEKKGWDYELYIDLDDQAKDKMDVYQIPNMYLVDGDGNVIHHELGYSKHGVNKFHKEIKKHSN